MDRQNKINDFVFALEGLSSNIIPKSFEICEKHLDALEDNIINYIRTNYPSVIFTKQELKDLVEKVYQKKHLNLKKSIDSNIGFVKYTLEAENVDVDKIITEEIIKYRTLFTSISAGTNISYLGLVNECTQNVMSMLIRKNTSISFAKRTEDISNYIYQLVNKSYFNIMDELGVYFINDVIMPIEKEFCLENESKTKIKAEEFF